MSEGQAGHGGPCWIILYGILGVAMAAQVSLLFLLAVGRVGWLVPVGWALFALSAVLGWAPILVFRRHGRVAKGRSYIHTTQLVTSGPYAIVRHPQFVAWDLLALAVMCITQHWGVYAAGGIGIAVNHLTMTKADRDLVEKFGDPYRDYMEQVKLRDGICSPASGVEYDIAVARSFARPARGAPRISWRMRSPLGVYRANSAEQEVL